MDPVTALGQALALSCASGVSPYATVAFDGLANRLGWIGSPPGELGILAHPLVFGVAGLLALVEALALLVPGLATAWETVHTAIRPLAAGALAALATWGSPRVAPSRRRSRCSRSPSSPSARCGAPSPGRWDPPSGGRRR